jgi:serine/threonine-protein kinase
MDPDVETRIASSPAGETLLRPQEAQRGSSARLSASGLPADLVSQSAARLRILALVYASVFFLAGFFPALLTAQDRAHVFATFTRWGPGVISIAVSLLVALVIRNPRVSLSATIYIGLVFEVMSSYGIAAAEFLDPSGLNMQVRWFGLSWVAVWVLLFTVVVPTTPRRAVVAALASVSAVPVVIGFAMTRGDTFQPSPMQFFFGLVFPYILVVVMAYVGARVVYSLGTEVSRARQLGSYHLVERLGHGGMGEVWRAKHRLLARPAAIKLIRPSLTAGGHAGASTDVLRRFEREAQATASLRSPHTVTLFDFGVADDGAFYYVMELLDGVDANTLVQRFGQLPYERVIHVLRQVCHSLAEAGARGLIHRDIKPANIFLCRYGEEFDFVKVLDFGLVKALDDAGETAVMTREHVVHGTPGYIAPEQALGLHVDGRVDIYATGCVAYWLLTGQQVFAAETPMALLMHHASTIPEPPSTRTELRIPAALDRIVMACLAKDPAERPQSAKALARELAEVEGADAWTDDRAREWWTNNLPSVASLK